MGRIFTLFTIFLITTVLAMAQPSAQDKDIVVSPVSGSSSSLRIDFTNGTGGVGHIVIVKNSTGSYTPSNGSPSPRQTLLSRETILQMISMQRLEELWLVF